MADNITLEFLAKQQEQILAELGTMRAIIERLDGTMAGLINGLGTMESLRQLLAWIEREMKVTKSR